MTPDDMINDVLGLDQETLNDQEFYIGEIFDGIYPPEAAIWCNTHNAFIEQIGDKRYEIKEIPEPAQPTHEEVRQMRAEAYRLEKDPITCHIQALRDEDPESPEIAELIAERTAVVEAIKERLPYPDEEENA